MSSFREVNALRIAFYEKEVETIDQRRIEIHTDLAEAEGTLFAAQLAAQLASRHPLVFGAIDAQVAIDAQAAINAMTQELGVLESRRRTLRDEIFDLRMKLDPLVMATFPSELLRRILFETATALDADLNMHGQSHTRRYNAKRALLPFQFSAVCRRWRHVALHAPSLWGCYLAPPPFREMGMNTERVQAYVDTVLSYSESSPLDVMLMWSDLDEATWTSRLTQLHDILRTLGAQSGRWRSFYLDLPVVDMHAKTFEIFRQATPLLEEFSVCTDVEVPARIWRGAYPVFLPECPKLRHFTTDGCPVVWSTPRPTPMSVTSIDLGSASLPPEFIFGMLESCPSLATLILYVMQPVAWRPTRRLRLPVLRELRIRFGADVLFAPWAEFLVFPSLSTLALTSVKPAHLTPLLLHIGATISILSLIGVASLGPAELDCLAHLPKLTSISFLGCSDEAGISAQFFERWSSRQALPCLQTATFSHTPFADHAAKAFLGLVRSRTIHASPDVQRLQRVVFEADALEFPKWLLDQVALLIHSSV